MAPCLRPACIDLACVKGGGGTILRLGRTKTDMRYHVFAGKNVICMPDTCPWPVLVKKPRLVTSRTHCLQLDRVLLLGAWGVPCDRGSRGLWNWWVGLGKLKPPFDGFLIGF